MEKHFLSTIPQCEKCVHLENDLTKMRSELQQNSANMTLCQMRIQNLESLIEKQHSAIQKIMTMQKNTSIYMVQDSKLGEVSQ